MNKLRKLFALTAVMAMVANSSYSQECWDDSVAYTDSTSSAYMSAIIPIGALVIAGIIIATTDRHHHHHSHAHSGIISHY